MKMYQVIDIGNTFCKIATCSTQDIDKVESYAVKSLRETGFKVIADYLNQPFLKAAIVSSVIDDSSLQELLQQFNHKIKVFDNSSVMPIRNVYKTPQTLGNDRLAAAVGARILFPETTILIIDAGTCVTCDLLLSTGEFIGGSISLGIQMRFNALHAYTSQLPLLTERIKVELTGTTTRESILSGVLNGITLEMQGIISAYQLQYPLIKVVITGGDILYFENKLKNSIFAEPNLMIKGLLHILVNQL